MLEHRAHRGRQVSLQLTIDDFVKACAVDGRFPDDPGMGYESMLLAERQSGG